MESMNPSVNRYSDADLVEFKAVIDKKLAAAYEELEYLKEQLDNTSETMEKEGDYMEGSSSFSDLEMLQTMQHRQVKLIQNLENALLRIKNKSYGICTVTGELIDKRRLLAVPTTSQSLAAKLSAKPVPGQLEEPALKKPEPAPAPPKVITKVVSKPTAPKPSSKVPLDDLDIFDEDDDLDASDVDFDLGIEGDIEEMED